MLILTFYILHFTVAHSLGYNNIHFLGDYLHALSVSAS